VVPVAREKTSDDYRDYVIRDGRFIGEFEEMYRHVDDPWHIGDAGEIQYDLILLLLGHYHVCEPGGEILDLGCGKGSFTARLRTFRPEARIRAVDISPTAIAKARQQYGSQDIDFSVMDIQSGLDGFPRAFDLVILSQMVWYVLPRFQEIAAQILTSVLRDGGYLLINQAFYRPGEQRYGTEIIATVEDLLRLVGREPLAVVESNRQTNHNAVILYRTG
jgi:SAM-dependent methyltransferase